jgi:hypothetical protein
VVALFDWPGESPGIADHIGITVPEPFLAAQHPALLASARSMWGHLGHGDFWSVEGNTSPTNDSNGGEVWLRKRNRSLVLAFVAIEV